MRLGKRSGRSALVDGDHLYLDHIGRDSFSGMLARAVALACDLEAPPLRELQRIAERWRPYRTWVSFLLCVVLEEQTHEIAGTGAVSWPRTPRRPRIHGGSALAGQRARYAPSHPILIPSMR